MPRPAPRAMTRVCNTSTALLKKSILFYVPESFLYGFYDGNRKAGMSRPLCAAVDSGFSFQIFGCAFLRLCVSRVSAALSASSFTEWVSDVYIKIRPFRRILTQKRLVTLLLIGSRYISTINTFLKKSVPFSDFVRYINETTVYMIINMPPMDSLWRLRRSQVQQTKKGENIMYLFYKAQGYRTFLRYWCGSQIWRGCIKIVHFGA